MPGRDGTGPEGSGPREGILVSDHKEVHGMSNIVEFRGENQALAPVLPPEKSR